MPGRLPDPGRDLDRRLRDAFSGTHDAHETNLADETSLAETDPADGADHAEHGRAPHHVDPSADPSAEHPSPDRSAQDGPVPDGDRWEDDSWADWRA